MKDILYAGSVLRTGDDIAIALLKYGEALAETGIAETVAIPVLEPDGSRTMATFLLGPSSQMVAKDVNSDFPELEDGELILHLTNRSRAQHPTGDWEQSDDQPPGGDDRNPEEFYGEV